jgi:hypothetical protein
MRALTLTQPWCGLVASGLKRVENRPRQLIRREDFGRPFALHASRVIDEAVYSRIFEIAPELPGRTPAEHGCRWHMLSRITSAVIAVATIERAVVEWHDGSVGDAHGVNGGPVVDLGDQRRWFFGPVGYVLRDVRALATPVPCRGWQGFWTLTPDVERAVVEQLGAAS